MKTKQSLWGKLVASGGWAVFTMLVWELVEEGLESAIAYMISSATALFVAKALSTLGIVLATQSIKVLVKRFLYPFIKTLTYKEGNDKMNKIKKFFSWLNANKCTIGGIALGATTAISGAGLIDVSTFPALLVGGFNLTPVIYYGLLGALTIVVSFFPETIEKFKERVAKINAEKEQNKIDKVAAKELKHDQKVANQTQAEKEKETAKKQAEEKAKLDKAKAEAEYRAKVDAAKAKLKAEEAKK